MVKSNLLREDFDLDRNFVAVREFKYNGRMYGPGQPFDKSATDERRLRQLYDTRFLRMAGGHTDYVPVIEHPPPQIEMLNMVPGLRPEADPEPKPTPPPLSSKPNKRGVTAKPKAKAKPKKKTRRPLFRIVEV